MSDWASKFSHFDSMNTSKTSRGNASFNRTFKFKPKEQSNRYTPLNKTPSKMPPPEKQKTPSKPEPKRQNFNFRSEKMNPGVVDDWAEDDDAFAELLDNDDDLTSAMDAFENCSPPQENSFTHKGPKISDEELQEMTMALMNDDDDWDLDEDNVPAPMDSAKARLNQTTAVFAGPCVDDFYDDLPKPEEIIKNLKEENMKLEKELKDVKPKVMASDKERYELKEKLDLKAKELEKELRLRRNLELNMKKELERVERQAVDKDKELKKLKVELSKEKSKVAKTTFTQQLPNDISTQQDPQLTAANKKRKLSASSNSEPAEVAKVELKSAFTPFKGLDLPDFFLEQFCLLGGILGDTGTKLPQHPQVQATHNCLDVDHSSDDELTELKIF